MHTLQFSPDIEHPLHDMLDDIKKARSKSNGYVDMWIESRKQARTELEKDFKAKCDEAIKAYRGYFPEHKDYEIKIMATFPRGNYVKIVFEIRIPYLT